MLHAEGTSNKKELHLIGILESLLEQMRRKEGLDAGLLANVGHKVSCVSCFIERYLECYSVS